MSRTLINSERPRSKHCQKIIKWVNGMPVPAFQAMLKTSAIQELPLTVLSLPYQRTDEEIFDGIDEEFEALTNG